MCPAFRLALPPTSIISLESLSSLRRRQYPQGGFLFTEEGTEVETELREHSLLPQDRSLASLMGCSDPDPGEAERGRQENGTFLIALEPGLQKPVAGVTPVGNCQLLTSFQDGTTAQPEVALPRHVLSLTSSMSPLTLVWLNFRCLDLGTDPACAQ